MSNDLTWNYGKKLENSVRLVKDLKVTWIFDQRLKNDIGLITKDFKLT